MTKKKKHTENDIKQVIDYYENIIAKMPGHVFWKDKDGVFLGCNDQQAKTLGLKSRHDVVGKSTYEMIWDGLPEAERREEARKIKENDKRIMETGKAETIEEPLIKPDGTTAIFLSHKSPLFDDDGNVVGLLGFALDITAEKEAERLKKEAVLLKKQAELKNYYENIIAKMPGHVFWKDRNAVLQGCNDQQAKTIGLKSRHDVVGMTNYDMVIQNQPEAEKRRQADEITKIDKQVMETGKARVVEEPLVLPDGSTKIYLSNKSPIFDDNGNVIGLLGIAFDITAEKEAEKLQEEKTILQKQLESATILGGSIAHELRTPLASIDNTAGTFNKFLKVLTEDYELVKKEPDKKSKINITDKYIQKLARNINDIQSEVKESNTFIDMLLMNITSQKIVTTTFQTYSMHDCVVEAIDRYPFTEQQSDLVNYEPKNDFQFKGSQQLMVHILFNLFKNALFYIADAGKGEIYISMRNDDQKYNHLIFKDTSKGISKEELPYIFERFHTARKGGSGIGLTFCKRVMEAHGGQITCSSEIGVFTEFVLSFPKIEE